MIKNKSAISFMKSISVLMLVFGLATFSAYAQMTSTRGMSGGMGGMAGMTGVGGGITFAKLDARHDGKVSLKEIIENYANDSGAASRRVLPPEQLFGLWDADGDGLLTKDEFNNRPQRGR